MHRHNRKTYHSVASPQRRTRHGCGSPEEKLLRDLQHSAIERLGYVNEFIQHWPARKSQLFRDAYERWRAEVRLHLAWIFEPNVAGVFSFRDICELSSHPALKNFDAILEEIAHRIDETAWTELNRPLDPYQAFLAESEWLNGVAEEEPAVAGELSHC